MLYHLLAPLAEYNIIFNVFRYVTFRAIAAFITALIFSFFLGPKIIGLLKKYRAVETINDVVPDSHKKKQGTPTMGGTIIIAGLLLSCLLWNNLSNIYILLMFLTTIWLGALGFLDDYLKNFRHVKHGLLEKYKLIGQIVLAVIVAFVLFSGQPEQLTLTGLNFPFLKNVTLTLGWLFIPFVIFVIVATSNAVNLTDGLDGLAGGTIAIASLGLGIIAYIKGNYNLAHYFHVDFIREAGELTVFTSALMGTLLGFLWYNTHPAEIFMGDTGSLALGGILAMLAILLREEVLFVIIGGIFVVEAGSSLIQRYYFKYTRIRTGVGKRIFLRAPLHHHFEMQGIPETKIVIRFWIVAILLTAVGLATLKLR